MNNRALSSIKTTEAANSDFKQVSAGASTPVSYDSWPGPNLTLATVKADTYPEGWRAWTIVLGSWLALLCSLGILSSIATFHAYLHSY